MGSTFVLDDMASPGKRDERDRGLRQRNKIDTQECKNQGLKSKRAELCDGNQREESCVRAGSVSNGRGKLVNSPHIPSAMYQTEPTCTCGKCTFNVNKKVAEQDALVKLMQFLMGLIPNFDVIRSQILNLNPIPSLNKAYAMVIAEETQKQKKQVANLTAEGIADTPISQDNGQNAKRDLANVFLSDEGSLKA
ncbi:uncharacterized protein G2W53_033944 [Senna tora]|uniref:Uncharacterized protein n=1 Tax=Senna tora TaxID=362788 RepID=A0A834T075_9FABA|nr:uncharacterized protein G2W53_033944 [Senna tora]